jgi:hypothetical protein
MAGQLIAWHYGRLEARVLRQSDEVVVMRVSEARRPDRV